MADGIGAAALILFWVVFSIERLRSTNKDYLKSIDKKMHTHAADGSLVGIRGWY